MAWYIMLDALSMEALPGGGGNVGIQLLRDGKGTAVVPLFTSEERYRDFIEECEFDRASMKPFPMPLDIFDLGKILRPLGESEERHLVAVDPFVVGDDWESLRRILSVNEFCLFLETFRPVARELIQKGMARFGHGPGAKEKIMDWLEPLIDKKVGDVHAVLNEHLAERNNR